jgi:hypothetical protein
MIRTLIFFAKINEKKLSVGGGNIKNRRGKIEI